MSAIRAKHLAALSADIYAVAPGAEREARTEFYVRFKERQLLNRPSVSRVPAQAVLETVATPPREATVLREAFLASEIPEGAAVESRL
jgi:hypothetical protein